MTLPMCTKPFRHLSRGRSVAGTLAFPHRSVSAADSLGRGSSPQLVDQTKVSTINAVGMPTLQFPALPSSLQHFRVITIDWFSCFENSASSIARMPLGSETTARTRAHTGPTADGE